MHTDGSELFAKQWIEETPAARDQTDTRIAMAQVFAILAVAEQLSRVADALVEALPRQ